MIVEVVVVVPVVVYTGKKPVYYIYHSHLIFRARKHAK